MKEKYYYEENSNQKIFYLIFEKEDSNTGKYYNNFTLKFLEHSYQVTDFIKFDVNESLKEKFLKLSKEIIENADNIINNKILKNK